MSAEKCIDNCVICGIQLKSGRRFLLNLDEAFCSQTCMDVRINEINEKLSQFAAQAELLKRCPEVVELALKIIKNVDYGYKLTNPDRFYEKAQALLLDLLKAVGELRNL